MIIISTHPLIYNLPTHPLRTSTLPTHPLNTTYQLTLLTHPTYQHTLSCSALNEAFPLEDDKEKDDKDAALEDEDEGIVTGLTHNNGGKKKKEKTTTTTVVGRDEKKRKRKGGDVEGVAGKAAEEESCGRGKRTKQETKTRNKELSLSPTSIVQWDQE